jgi:cation transport ATPase
LSEQAYSSVDGEYGALNAGLVASFFIGAIYFSPLALLFKQVRRGNLNIRIVALIAMLSCIAVLISIIVDNQIAMMITTPLFVITIIAVSAILSARLIMKSKQKILDMI